MDRVSEMSERLRALEIISARADRKRGIVRETKISPSVISFYASSGHGVLFRYVMLKGTLVRAVYRLKAAHQNDTQNAVKFQCELSNKFGSQSAFINVKKLEGSVELDIPTNQGDILTVSGETEDIIFEDLSITFLFIADDSFRKIENEIV
jgi:hypothetical protein